MAFSNRSTFDKLRVIRALDQMLWPLVLLVARVLAKIPRKQDSRIVIIRPGGMGDLICLHMAALDLGLDPRSFIWVIEKRSLPWAKLMNLDHRIISPRLVFEVARYRHVINSEQHYGASQIIAVALAGRSRQLTSLSTVRGTGISNKICPYSPTKTHEVDSFAALLSMGMGIDSPGSSIQASKVRKIEHGLVVALGGGHAESRALTLEQWSEIVKVWTDGHEFSIISGPVESELAEGLVAVFGKRAEYKPGTFQDNCRIIEGAQRVLTIDGGLTHVASFFGTPTDTLFTSGQDELWAPRAPGSRIFVRGDIPCRPCTMFGYTPRCPVGLICTKGLQGVVQSAI